MRIHGEAETYRRLFFRGRHLVGGVIIGSRKGLPKLLQLVRERTPIPRDERSALLTLE